jgi:recombination protein RecR
MEFSSKLIEKAVNEIAQLPGIGRSALRLVLHLLKQPKEQTGFSSSIGKYAKILNIVPTVIIYQIVLFAKSVLIETTKLYVVEDIRDVMAIENTGNIEGVSRFRW